MDVWFLISASPTEIPQQMFKAVRRTAENSFDKLLSTLSLLNPVKLFMKILWRNP